MASTALAPVFTRSYKPASTPPRFSSSGGRPWEDLSLKLKAGAQHRNVEGLLPEGDQLASLPLELLLLICEHASFGTLLALSRTSKALRRILLTRSRLTEDLWDIVREKEGWPVNIDKEMSVVRYAELLEGRDCQLCDKGWRASKLITRLAARCCAGCEQSHVLSMTELKTQHPHLHPYTFMCARDMKKPSQPGAALLDTFFFMPDILVQSAKLYHAEALAAMRGAHVPSASSAYLAERMSLRAAMPDQAASIEAQAAAHASADQARSKIDPRYRAENELEALGYGHEDYGDLSDQWWYEAWWMGLAEQVGEGEQDLVEGADEDEDEDEEADWDKWWMSELLNQYFDPDVEGYDEPVEWDDVDLWVVTYVHRRRLLRLDKEARERRADRQQEMRPLADQILALLPPSLRRTFPSFADFTFLPAVKPFWYADSAVVDPSTWSASHPAILADVLRSIRALKLRLFSRSAHALPSTSLPPHVALTLSSEIFDADPHRAPLHHLLSDADTDAILSRPTVFFRCGVCSTKLVYPSIVEHLRDEHSASAAQCAAWACAPDERFGEAVRALLEAAEELGEETTDEDLRGMGVVFEVDEEAAGGHVVRTRESWDQLTSGRHLEDRAWRYEINPSPDRRIVAIRLAR